MKRVQGRHPAELLKTACMFLGVSVRHYSVREVHLQFDKGKVGVC